MEAILGLVANLVGGVDRLELEESDERRGAKQSGFWRSMLG